MRAVAVVAAHTVWMGGAKKVQKIIISCILCDFLHYMIANSGFFLNFVAMKYCAIWMINTHDENTVSMM